MGFDRLRVDALLPDAREQDLLRDVPRAEAGDLDSVGEIVRCMLDRVLNLAGRHLYRQAGAVTVELFDLGLHRRAIESERSGLPLAVGRSRDARLRAMELDAAIRSRRTHKAFEPEPVDPETIEELFELARFAPNHHLTEPWRFRVLGPETFDKLVAAGAANEASKLGRAPTLVVASARLTGRRVPESRGRPRNRLRDLHRAARGPFPRPRVVLADTCAARDPGRPCGRRPPR